MKISRFFKQFNWRFLLVRILVNAIALAVTAIIVPKIYFVDKSIWNWLLMAFMLGVLNALLKPILQFLTLQFIFVTYGLVVVLVNTLLLWLLSFLFPARFAVDNLLWALLGGLVLGLLSSFLESLLGLTMPIVPDEPAELRQQVEEQARSVDWLAAERHEAVAEEHALAIEAPAPEAKETSPALEGPAAALRAVAEPAEADLSAALRAGVEPSPPGPDEGPSPPAKDEAEPLDPVVTPPAEAGGVVDPETEPREEQEEDRL